MSTHEFGRDTVQPMTVPKVLGVSQVTASLLSSSWPCFTVRMVTAHKWGRAGCQASVSRSSRF